MSPWREETIVGEPERVAAALRNLHARGDLVAYTPQPQTLADGRVAVAVRLVDHQAPARPHRQWGLIAGAAGGAVSLLGAVGFAVWWLVGQLVAALAVLPSVLVVLAIAYLVVRSTGRGDSGGGGGRHCPGCRD